MGARRPSSGERTKQPLVLVVEQSDDLRRAFVDALAGVGFTTLGAGNGHEAVVKASAMRPELVVLDLSVPLLGGRDTLRVLRSQPRTRGALVLALAERPTDLDDIDSFDGALRKPCTPAMLVLAVQGLLTLARRKRASP
ncbi:MAG TPA: response regulator [Polyangiaceae bacterium]